MQFPEQRGSATKKTTNPDGKSFFKYLKVNPLGFFINNKIMYVIYKELITAAIKRN
jgi:hypothetical protein